MSYKSFELLHKLYFVRTGGSAEEKKAAEILKAECESLDVEASIETFKVDGYKEIKSSLKFINPDMEIECVAVGMSSSTSEEGIVSDFTYVTSLADAEIQDLEGKVCLVHSKLVNVKLYKKLVEKKAAALVLCCGDVYRDADDVDLDPYMYRNRHYDNGKIPAVCIRMKDAEKVLRAKPQKAHVIMVEEELQNDSYNVVATIEGTTNVYPQNLEETLYIFGEKGTVKIGGKSTNNIDVWNFADETAEDEKNKGLEEATSNVYGNGHTSLFADVMDAIQSDRKPYVDAYAGRDALELVLAIYKSQKEGKAVKLPLENFASIDMKGEFV